MKKAFTLIELILVVGLVTVMTSASLTGFVNYNRRQVVVATTEALKQAHRLARANVIAGKVDCAVCESGVGDDNTCNGVGGVESPVAYWRVGTAVVGGVWQVITNGVCSTSVFMQKTQIFNPSIQIVQSCANVQYLSNGTSNAPVAGCNYTVSWLGSFPQSFSVTRSGLVD